MPVYRLSPRDAGLEDQGWTMSWHRNPCYVVAETALQARRYANGAFIIPLQSAASASLPAALPLPWSSDDLVTVQKLAGIAEFGQLGTASVTLPPPARST